MLSAARSSDSDAPLLDDAKPELSPNHLYYRQPYSVQIIELIECPAPPLRNIASVVNDSASSSDYTSSFCSDYDDDDASDQDNDEVVSSFCSSELPTSRLDGMDDDDEVLDCKGDAPLRPKLALGDSQRSEFAHILAWRESFNSTWGSSHATACFHTEEEAGCQSTSASAPVKRKLQSVLNVDDESNDMAACHLHSAKRLRSHHDHSQISISESDQDCSQCQMIIHDRGWTVSVDTYLCPACDAVFATRSELRLHGIDSCASDACRISVEYVFE